MLAKFQTAVNSKLVNILNRQSCFCKGHNDSSENSTQVCGIAKHQLEGKSDISLSAGMGVLLVISRMILK